MKKILFLILLSVTAYGQVPADATPLENIQLTNNVVSTSAPSVVVQETNGVMNKINKNDIIEYLEFASAVNLPVTGVAGKLYLTRDNNRLYRWNGTVYSDVTTDITGKEDIANKTSSFATSSTTTYPNSKALSDGLATKIGGSGTTNFLPIFTGSGTIGNSAINEVSGNVGIGVTSASSKLEIRGDFGSSPSTGVFKITSDSVFESLSMGMFSTGLFLPYMQGYTRQNGLAQTISLQPFGGRIVVNKQTDDGVNQLQVNGNITASEATLSNQVVVKSQLDLKANLASPSLTGTPTAPTATAGTNTTQIATTAFVLANALNIPQLERNSTDLTVWNNGKSNVVSNTTFGESALKSNTVNGFNNTAIGFESLQANTDGDGNTSTGSLALRLNNTGGANTAIGFSSLLNTTTGGNNTALGANSLINNTTGGNNTALGANAGRFIADGVTVNQTSNTSVFLGASTRSLSSAQTNEIVIGQDAIGAGSNTATLGNASITQTILRGTVSAPTVLSTSLAGTGTRNVKATSTGQLTTSDFVDAKSARFELSADINLPISTAGSVSVVDFDSSVFNNDTVLFSNNGSGVITCNRAGIYLVTTSVVLESPLATALTRTDIGIRKNGTTIVAATTNDSTLALGNNVRSMTTTTIINLAANDTIATVVNLFGADATGRAVRLPSLFGTTATQVSNISIQKLEL